MSYSYNPEGQKTQTNTASGSSLYSYDVLGRLATVRDQLIDSTTNAPVDIAAYSYDAVGNLATLTRGNGVVATYDYDALNRLSDITNKLGTSVVSHFHYDVRADGKRTKLDEQVVNADAGRVSTRSVGYGYDDAGKLTDEVGQDGRGVGFSSHWDYDGVGNRVGTTAKTATQAAPSTLSHITSVSAVFNANDWLTSQTTQTDAEAAKTQTWAYDDNGAELSVANESGSTGNAWSYEGKLLATQTKSAAGAVNGGTTNVFDAAGDRVSMRTSVPSGGTKTTSYLVDETAPYAAVVEESAPDANDTGVSRLQARYVWGGGLAPVAMWRRVSSSFKLFYFVSDGQESVRQLTDASGAVTDSYFYDAWGNALAGGSGSTANSFRYTGQQLDPDGKYFLRARFYDPTKGRFLGHDPLMGNDEDSASLHRYFYAGADGVNASDPSGEMTLSEAVLNVAIVYFLSTQYVISLDHKAGYDMRPKSLMDEPYRSQIVNEAQSQRIEPLFLASILAYEIDDLSWADRLFDIPFRRTTGIAQANYATAKTVHPEWSEDDFMSAATNPMESIALAARVIRYKADNPPKRVRTAGTFVYDFSSVINSTHLKNNGATWSLAEKEVVAYTYTQGWQLEPNLDSLGRIQFHINSRARGYGYDVVQGYMEGVDKNTKPLPSGFTTAF